MVVHRLKGGKRWLMAPAAALVLVGAYALTGTTSALGDTHGDCVTVDDQGNMIFTPSCSETVHVTSAPNVFPNPNPCTGGTGTVELDDNHSVFHINVNGDGDAWLTGTDGGTASFTPDDPSQASGQGTWTSWFGTELNNQSTVNSGTNTVRLKMSDGTHVVIHETTHMTMTPDGNLSASFDHVSVSCGG